MLTWIICLPLLAALFLTLVPRQNTSVIRTIAIGITAADMLLALGLFFAFNAAPALDGYKFVQRVPWIPSLGISYYVGVDGINLGLVVMGAMVAFAAVCVSSEIKSHQKEFYILLLVMTGGILGAFASLDLFFFYCFHEFALVPTFIMIGLWGSGEKKNYATFQITIYLTIGALLALAGLILLYLQRPVGERTFDIVRMTRYFTDNPIGAANQNLIFALLLFGFGILVSLFPFHTWAPLGYGVAPTATAMLHAGVLKKFGLYGLIRIALPMLPEGAKTWVPVLAWLCLGNILYCGWVAMRQKDLNLLIGNSSVAHVGFAFLGIASLDLIGVTGAVLVMVAHGFLAALSFGLSGYLFHATGTRDMTRLGGLLQQLPFIGTALVMALLAGCGVPGFANFVGELLVMFGAWKGTYSPHPHFYVAAVAWGGLVVAALYALRAIRHLLHGPTTEIAGEAQDATVWRRVPFVLLLASLVCLGVFPRLLTDKIKASAEATLKFDSGKRPSPGLAVTAINPAQK
jgi:NADH-quinone oxidoreductase subunit M